MTYDASSHHGQTQHSSGGSGMAITALVLGIFALLTSWTVVGGILLGLAALVVGFIALSRIKQGRAGGKVMAVIGIITGALGLVAAIALIAIGASLLNSEPAKNLQDCLEKAGNDEAAQTQCESDFQEELQN